MKTTNTYTRADLLNKAKIYFGDCEVKEELDFCPKTKWRRFVRTYTRVNESKPAGRLYVYEHNHSVYLKNYETKEERNNLPNWGNKQRVVKKVNSSKISQPSLW